MDDNDYDDIGAMLRQSAEEFIAGQSRSAAPLHVTGQPRSIDRVAWAQMAELGWLALALPESSGGSGMGLREATALCEVFGRTLFAEPFIAAALMPALVLGRAQGHAEQASLCAGLGQGKKTFALAWQESIGQVEPIAPATRLVDGRLHGRKCFVHGVEPGCVLLVHAQMGREPVVVVVDADADGVSVERHATAQGALCQIAFEGAAVHEGAPLLSSAAARSALAAAIGAARIAASAQLAGMARGCLDKTVQYVSQRVQFGHPIGSFQSVAHRCVDLRIGVELSEASWRHACQSHVADAADAQSAGFAAKARCSDVALDVGRVAVQLHGAMGFTEEADIGHYLRAALQYSAWLGGSAELRRRFLVAERRALREAAAHA